MLVIQWHYLTLNLVGTSFDSLPHTYCVIALTYTCFPLPWLLVVGCGLSVLIKCWKHYEHVYQFKTSLLHIMLVIQWYYLTLNLVGTSFDSLPHTYCVIALTYTCFPLPWLLVVGCGLSVLIKCWKHYEQQTSLPPNHAKKRFLFL